MSSSKEQLEMVKDTYDEALRKSGYGDKTCFIDKTTRLMRRLIQKGGEREETGK